MANTNPGGEIGRIKVSDLAAIWGDEVIVKRSQNSDKTYPLYLSTPTGTVFFNTRRGQNFILDHAVIPGATAPVQDPEPAASPSKTTETEEHPAAKKSRWGGFLSLDE